MSIDLMIEVIESRIKELKELDTSFLSEGKLWVIAHNIRVGERYINYLKMLKVGI